MTQCITSYQAKYFAHSLTRRLPANDGAKFTATLQDARVDLTPHQIGAALFAFKSPLSKLGMSILLTLSVVSLFSTSASTYFSLTFLHNQLF